MFNNIFDFDIFGKSFPTEKELEKIDVTTDEGIAKTREIIANLKEQCNKLKDVELFGVKFVDDSIVNTLDNILENAESKYAAAKGVDGAKSKDCEMITSVLQLPIDEATEVKDAVDNYLETVILPKLPENYPAESLESIRRSLEDYTAWLWGNNDEYED